MPAPEQVVPATQVSSTIFPFLHIFALLAPMQLPTYDASHLFLSFLPSSPQATATSETAIKQQKTKLFFITHSCDAVKNCAHHPP
jgi:hypothetical protein